MSKITILEIKSNFCPLKKLKIILLILVGTAALIIFSFMAFKQWSYEKMTQTILSNTVEQIEVSSADIQNYRLLDARSIEENGVSKIQGAERIDPDTKEFEPEILNSEKPILVYCSVGLRSERIGERLKKINPALKVYNLKGGIFQWVNDEKPLVNQKGDLSDSIHTYNTSWSIWVSKGKKVN